MSPNHKSSESRNKDTSIASARATNTSRNELNTSSSRYVNTKAKVQEAMLNKDLQGVSVRESSVKGKTFSNTNSNPVWILFLRFQRQVR